MRCYSKKSSSFNVRVLYSLPCLFFVFVIVSFPLARFYWLQLTRKIYSTNNHWEEPKPLPSKHWGHQIHNNWPIVEHEFRSHQRQCLANHPYVEDTLVACWRHPNYIQSRNFFNLHQWLSLSIKTSFKVKRSQQPKAN